MDSITASFNKVEDVINRLNECVMCFENINYWDNISSNQIVAKINEVIK